MTGDFPEKKRFKSQRVRNMLAERAGDMRKRPFGSKPQKWRSFWGSLRKDVGKTGKRKGEGSDGNMVDMKYR